MFKGVVPRLLLLATTAGLAAACSETDTMEPQPNISVNGVASTGWQAQARALVASNSQSPLAAARVYAALGVAQYAALDDVASETSSQNDNSGDGFGAGGRARYEAERGAVAGASARVLSFLYPAAAPALEQRVVTEGNEGPGNVHPAFTRGVAVGRAAGDWMVARLQADHFTTPWTGTVPTGPGIFVPNGAPAGANLGAVTPYFLSAANQFRPAAPPAFQSPTFLAELAEVKTTSDTRTPQQLATALQWNYGNGTYTPPGYWNELAGELIRQQGLSEREATRVFALVGAAGFDALIGCWEAKYYYWHIRPWQAQSGINLPIGAPNHPSYPSGHSCVSSAMATVLADFFPSHASQIGAQVTDAGLSRLYGGIHFRSDLSAGEQLGRSTAQHAITLDKQLGLLSVLR